MQLADFDTAAFLRDYWQKRPLLIRNPWTLWRNPLEPDELAGLACEEGIEARLILRCGGALAVENGPFADTRFGELGDSGWTLLVQAVDHHVPAVAELIAPFRFVPDWRIDDVMVSYATDGGGVGPHFDQYDVFLVQGLGRRRWRVGPVCDADTPLLPHEDLRLIADFTATGEWVLEPGDILYVPPGFAHDGAALGDDCMTYSIGFRAPSRADLVEGWAEHRADALAEDDRYADPDLAAQANPGEITAPALARLHAMVTAALDDPAAFARWFGEYNTLPKYPDTDWRPEDPPGAEAVRALLSGGAALIRNPASRFAFTREGEGKIVLFADGQAFDCAGDVALLAERLCSGDGLAGPAVSVEESALIATLIAQGSVAFEDED
jgi:50S ribosomal protein L16 3-hydroxylase